MRNTEDESETDMGDAVNAAPDAEYDVFISYRRDGGLDLARSIAYWFRSNDVKCFIDQTEMTSGKFNEQIYGAIDGAKYFLLLVTENALDRCCNEGDWVRREIEHALKRRKDKEEFIVPVTPLPNYIDALPANLPDSLTDLKYIQASSISRTQNFEGTMREMVCRQMKEFGSRLENSRQKREDMLCESIRSCKRNDGIIDEVERSKLELDARCYGMEDQLQAMINKVEEEWRKEQAFVTGAAGKYRLVGNKLSDPDEKAVRKAASEFGVEPNRVGELVAEIEQTIRKRKCLLRLSLLPATTLLILVVALSWLHGRRHGGDAASERAEREIVRLKAEVEKARKECSKAKSEVENLKLNAAKDVAALSRERDVAVQETKDVKDRLSAALESASAADASRVAAEKMLSDAAKRAKEVDAALAAEKTARRAAESKNAEQSSELDRVNMRMRGIEEENDRLRKNLETLKRQMQVDALHDT